MLAEKYSDKLTDGNWPVMVQPKLDGIRCIIRREGDDLVARSRTGKVFDTLEYLLTELNGLFQRYPFLVLDGELYNHDTRIILIRLYLWVERRSQTTLPRNGMKP